jgi:hypothetical protein
MMRPMTERSEHPPHGLDEERIAVAVARGIVGNKDTTQWYRWPRAEMVKPVAGTPCYPTPFAACGRDGRALLCAGDIVYGLTSYGSSAIVAPGELLRIDGESNRSFTWRVAVYAGSPRDPLRDGAVRWETRSLRWVVALLCDIYELGSAQEERGGTSTAKDHAVEAIAWVAAQTRDVLHWHLARLRPQVGREPHHEVVAETRPLLRDGVLDAARVFGQAWVEEVLEEWAHLATTSASLRKEYVLEGIEALEEALRRH